MSQTEKTINYYNQNAASFAFGTQDADMEELHRKFADKLGAESFILDFGCGSGRDTRAFLSDGIHGLFFRTDSVWKCWTDRKSFAGLQNSTAVFQYGRCISRISLKRIVMMESAPGGSVAHNRCSPRSGCRKMAECDFAKGLDHRGCYRLLPCCFAGQYGLAEQQHPCRDLHHENHRHTDDEVPVSSLVMEQIHSGDGADTAADYGREKECAFRNTPVMADSALLIRIHQNKCCQIYNNKINHP